MKANVASHSRRRTPVISAAALALAIATQASAADDETPKFRLSFDDWYVSSFGAVLVADENNILFDQFGWQGSVASGVRLNDGRFRLELEATRRRIGLVGLNGAGAAPGQFNARSAFMNGYVHLKPDAKFDPYIGGGFGRGEQNYRLQGMADEVDYMVVMDDTSTAKVYHGMAGVEVDLLRRLSANIETRYFTLEDKTIGANFGRWNGIERSYQLGVGLSYRFGRD